MSKSHSLAPLPIGRQPVALKRCQYLFTSFLFREPRTELVRVFPADTDNRIVGSLLKSERFPAHFIELESVLRHCRRHAADRVVACRLHERLEITLAGLPFRNVDIPKWHKTHVEAVCPWLSRLGLGTRTNGRIRFLQVRFSNILGLLVRC